MKEPLMCDEHKDNKFMLGFFIGGLVGALVIFFLGTKEGKRAGVILRKKGEETLDDLEERIEDLEEKGKDLVERGQELKEEMVDRLQDTTRDASRGMAKRIDHALEKLEGAQKQGLTTTSSIRRHFTNLPKKK